MFSWSQFRGGFNCDQLNATCDCKVISDVGKFKIGNNTETGCFLDRGLDLVNFSFLILYKMGKRIFPDGLGL